MEIKDIIQCKDNNILPIQSKMIANLLLSGSPYQIYRYKDVSNDIYKKYNTYIRYHKRFDENINIRSNVAPQDIGYYAGEISWLCAKLGLPLISVKINSENNMPNEGFFVFPQCEQMRKQGITDREIVRKIKQQVISAFEDGSYAKLINYINGTSIIKNTIEDNKTNDNNNNLEISTSNEFKQNTSEKVQPNNQTNYDEIEFYEGQTKERTILQQERNQKIVKLVKERDNYTCKACGFSYYHKIVEAHHLVPISNKNNEYEIIKIEDLITLCPTCHSLAHILLKADNKIYTNKIELLTKLKQIRNK